MGKRYWSVSTSRSPCPSRWPSRHSHPTRVVRITKRNGNSVEGPWSGQVRSVASLRFLRRANPRSTFRRREPRQRGWRGGAAGDPDEQRKRRNRRNRGENKERHPTELVGEYPARSVTLVRYGGHENLSSLALAPSVRDSATSALPNRQVDQQVPATSRSYLWRP